MLAAAVNDNHASQTFTVTYADGTTTVVSQSLSDWLTPQNYAGRQERDPVAPIAIRWYWRQP
jgi:hypothetical protein